VILLRTSRPVMLVSMTGERRVLRPVAGAVRVELAPFPVYVIER